MKIDYYLDNLRQYSNSELEKISNSKRYNRNAKIAAKQIIINRDNFKSHLKSIDDDELQKILYNKKEKFKRYELDIVLDEFKVRGLTPKIWFIKNKKQEEGPFTDKQLLNLINNKIKYHGTKIMKEGINHWYPANMIDNLFQENLIPKPQKNYLSTATNLTYVSSIIWLLIGILQFINGAIIFSIINLIGFYVLFFLVAPSLKKRRSSGFSGAYFFAIGTAIYNFFIVTFSSELDMTSRAIIAFMVVIIPLLIIILLELGKKDVIEDLKVDLNFNNNL